LRTPLSTPLALSAIERTREIGLLRAVGLGRVQLAGAFVIESVLAAVLGTSVGVGVAVALAAAVPTVFADVGLKTLAIPSASLGWMLVLRSWWEAWPRSGRRSEPLASRSSTPSDTSSEGIQKTRSHPPAPRRRTTHVRSTETHGWPSPPRQGDIMRTSYKLAAAAFGAAALIPLGMSSALAADGGANANLTPVALNGVNGSGTAMVTVHGNTISVTMAAKGLLADAPHAAHIHFGATARHECPAATDDTNKDGHLNTTEGGPAYGPVVVSLTKTGDTSPASVLAVDRFDTAPGGSIAYQRGSITVAPEVAAAILSGQAVVVVHGVDYNGNGKYDGTVMSELAPTLPTEATDPALCGVLKAAPVGAMATGAGGASQSQNNEGLLIAGGALLLAAVGAGTYVVRRPRTQA
jgi:hypothetical protein